MARPRNRRSTAKFSVSQLADMLEVDRSILSKRLTDSGAPSETGAKNARLYRVRDAVAAIADVLGIGGGDVAAMASARRRKAEADAEAAEFALAERRGELIPKTDVVTGLRQAIQHMRSRMLAIPTKAAPAVFVAESVGGVKEILKDHVHDALDELSRTRFVAVGADSEEKSAPKKQARGKPKKAAK